MTTTTRWRLLALSLLGLILMAASPAVQTAIASRLRWSDGSLLTLGAPPAEGEALVLTSGVLTGGSAGGIPEPGSPTTGDVLSYSGSAWVSSSPSSDLGLLTASTASSTYQPLDGDLTSIAALTTTSVGRGLLDDASAAALRDSVVWAGAGSIACASPCTPGAGVNWVTVSGTVTVNLPALSTYADGQLLRLVCDSASACTVTLDPSDSGTCDGGSAGAACAAISVPAHATVGAIRTSASAWGSVQPGIAPNAALVEAVNGALVAYGGTVRPDGSFLRLTAATTLTAEDDTYGESWSGDVLTVPTAGLVTGDTGAVQANSRRYVVALSSLGITLTDSSPRPTGIHLLCDDTADLDARAGTLALVTWLGAGASTTAIDIIGVQRPSTGSDTWVEVRARSSATSFTTGAASSATFGAYHMHQVPSDDGAVAWGALGATGAYRSLTATSGGAISATLPTHIVWALRASAGASGATWTDCRALYTFGATVEDL